MARASEYRELGDIDLIDRLEGSKEELFNLRFQLATGQLDDPSRIKAVRHDIARILTVLRERHLESEVEAEVARADAEALEHGREMQAAGKVKGSSLRDAVATSGPEDAELPAEHALEELEEGPK